jgi:hypothetical protein
MKYEINTRTGRQFVIEDSTFDPQAFLTAKEEGKSHFAMGGGIVETNDVIHIVPVAEEVTEA